MTIDTEPAQKRPYSRPTLIEYGTMAALTKTGSGSCVGRPGKRKKNYWDCDDD